MLDTSTQRLREEQEWTAQLEERAAEAWKVIGECDREHTESSKRQAVLSLTIAQYQDLLKLAGVPPPSAEAPDQAPTLFPSRDEQQPAAGSRDDAKSKLVARLGQQHYRMLHTLRQKGPLALDDLARASVASQRRVRLQMAEDSSPERAVVAMRNGKYELTSRGADLLRRFEDFRRSTGQELPSLDAPQSEADRDEVDLETANEGDCRATCKTHPSAPSGTQPPLASRGETGCLTK